MLAANTSVDKVNVKIKNYIKTKNKESNVELFFKTMVNLICIRIGIMENKREEGLSM